MFTNTLKRIYYQGDLYFISEKEITDSILYPRIPNNYFTKNGYEDNIHKRVCFCKTIEKCLMALSRNCTDCVFYVYKVDDVNDYSIYQPSVLEVPDCELTEELWILEDVKLKYMGKIKCIGSVKNDGFFFHYGSHIATLYDWKYEWL